MSAGRILDVMVWLLAGGFITLCLVVTVILTTESEQQS